MFKAILRGYTLSLRLAQATWVPGSKLARLTFRVSATKTGGHSESDRVSTQDT